MRDATYPEVPPDFGHWLAGFIDGEGCFTITRDTGGSGVTYRPYFDIKLRDDDLALLESIREVTGLGWIARRTAYGNSKPMALWRIHKRADLPVFVELLDRYPLRSRKARDYAIWREAVLLWASYRRRGNNHAPQPQDWTVLADLKQQMQAARAYRGAE